MAPLLLTAPRILCDQDTWIDGGGLLVERGRVARVLRTPAALRRARATRRLDFETGLLAPGYVNAHAHLELSGLRGAVSAERGFGAWVGALLAARASRAARALESDAASGAARLLATGTTTVGDVDTTGAGLRAALRPGGPRRVLYRELLDAWNPERTAPALAAVARGLRESALLREGLSPHAPFTASTALLAGAARIAARRRLAVSVHWSETEDEVRWLARGDGPLAALLPASPARAGLELLADAGLLTPRTSLVHGNHPARGEPERIARAGSTLIHCPGTHAFFARAPFPLRRYLRAGVTLALGTDSLASNDDLDLGRELALLRRAHPWLAPRRAFEMATTGAARALGLEREVGRIAPGLRADLVLLDARATSLAAALEELTAARPAVRAVVLGGRLAHG